jgi:hypothetical protein
MELIVFCEIQTSPQLYLSGLSHFEFIKGFSNAYGVPMRCTLGNPEFQRRGFVNLQGNLSTDLKHPLWSAYHTVREKDSKPRNTWGDRAPEPWQFLLSTAKHEVMSAPYTMYGSLPTY